MAPADPAPAGPAPAVSQASSALPAAGVVVGTLVALQSDATPWVLYPGQPAAAALAARTTCPIRADQIGCPVVLVFEAGDPVRPIILGLVRDGAAPGVPLTAGGIDIEADDQRLLVQARDSVVLRCGAASLTLTREGKVVIEGTYVLTRSSGANQIKGARIDLN